LYWSLELISSLLYGDVSVRPILQILPLLFGVFLVLNTCLVIPHTIVHFKQTTLGDLF